MRKPLMFLMIAAVTTLAARAQQSVTVTWPEPPRTDIGVFEAQTNVVIVKGVTVVNSVTMDKGTLSVRTKESLNVGTSQKEYGMLLSFDESGSERRRAEVDYSELGSMLSGIDYLSGISSDTINMAAFDAEYQTKDGFRVIARCSRRQGVVQYFFKFDEGDPIEISSYQLSQFRGILGSAKNTLDGLIGAK